MLRGDRELRSRERRVDPSDTVGGLAHYSALLRRGRTVAIEDVAKLADRDRVRAWVLEHGMTNFTIGGRALHNVADEIATTVKEEWEVGCPDTIELPRHFKAQVIRWVWDGSRIIADARPVGAMPSESFIALVRLNLPPVSGRDPLDDDDMGDDDTIPAIDYIYRLYQEEDVTDLGVGVGAADESDAASIEDAYVEVFEQIVKQRGFDTGIPLPVRWR